MTIWEIILAAVVLLVGVPSGFCLRRSSPWVRVRNATAASLVAAYFVVQSIYQTTGEVLSSATLWYIDLAVLAVIYGKASAPHSFCRDDRGDYRSFWRQLCGLWLERTVWDRFIIVCFPAAWWFYFAPVTPSAQWWSLYWISIAQVIASGGEVISKLRSSRAAKVPDKVAPDTSASGAEFAWVGESRGYG